MLPPLVTSRIGEDTVQKRKNPQRHKQLAASLRGIFNAPLLGERATIYAMKGKMYALKLCQHFSLCDPLSTIRVMQDYVAATRQRNATSFC